MTNCKKFRKVERCLFHYRVNKSKLEQIRAELEELQSTRLHRPYEYWCRQCRSSKFICPQSLDVGA